MAMISYPILAARRNNCIFALFPYDNGCFLHPLRSDSTLYPVPGTSTAGSWAVQNGLLSLTNCRFEPRGFASDCWWIADEYGDYKCCKITAPMDMRGNQTSKTFLVKNWCTPGYDPDYPRHGRHERLLHPLMQCGNNTSTDKDLTVFRFLIEETYDSATQSFLDKDYNCIAGFVFDGTGSDERETVELSTKLPAEYIDNYAVYALVVDYDSYPGFMDIKLYIAGELLARKTIEAKIWSTVDMADYRLALRTSCEFQYETLDFTAWGLIFDSALTEEEIKKFK